MQATSLICRVARNGHVGQVKGSLVLDATAFGAGVVSNNRHISQSSRSVNEKSSALFGRRVA